MALEKFTGKLIRPIQPGDARKMIRRQRIQMAMVNVVNELETRLVEKVQAKKAQV